MVGTLARMGRGAIGQVAILRCTLCPGSNKARKSDVKANFDLPRNREWCKHSARK
jgi:hypothetical protein